MARHPSKAAKTCFFDCLRQTGNVSAAARAAKLSRTRVYQLRKEDKDFRIGWEAALEEALDDLEGELRRRALEGTEKPVFYGGKPCGTIRSYNDTLAMFLLKGRRKTIFGDGKDAGEEQTTFVRTVESPRKKLLARLSEISKRRGA